MNPVYSTLILKYVNKYKNFHRLWNEELSLFPEVPMDKVEQEKYRLFANRMLKFVFNERDIVNLTDEIATTSFTAGEEKGQEIIRRRISDKIDALYNRAGTVPAWVETFIKDIRSV